jgi:hypothetical protein
MEIQTRCRGYLEYYNSIADAYNAWRLNPDIEKISWTDNTGNRQIWRPHIKGSQSPEIEAHLNGLSLNYRDTENGTLWWYLQLDIDILEITTNSGFYARFCK